MSAQSQEARDDAFELDCLFNWMRFLTGASRQYSKGDVVVHVYGEFDDSFIVIEKRIFAAPMPVDQYVLLTGDAANSLMSLVRLLKEFQFDLGRLIAKLERLDYGVEGRARLERVDVAYSVVGAAPSDRHETAAEEDEFEEVVVDESAADPATPRRSLSEIIKSLPPFDGRHGRPKAPRGD